MRPEADDLRAATGAADAAVQPLLFDMPPCECLGSAKLLTFHSGQGHASHGRLRAEQIEPSAQAMPGSGLPARGAGHSELGVRAGMTQREPAFSARHGRRGSARWRNAVPVLREASHSPAIAKIISNLGSPFGSLTIISSSERRSAQQGSNLRPLACKTSSYRRWTWPGAIHQQGPWLDVAWHGLVSVVVGSPFGSPVSLAPLTFSKHKRQPETRYSPAMATRERSMTVSPMSSSQGSGVSRQETLRRSTVRYRLGFKATAAPTDARRGGPGKVIHCTPPAIS
jgi:hypothetical protein